MFRCLGVAFHITKRMSADRCQTPHRTFLRYIFDGLAIVDSADGGVLSESAYLPGPASGGFSDHLQATSFGYYVAIDVYADVVSGSCFAAWLFARTWQRWLDLNQQPRARPHSPQAIAAITGPYRGWAQGHVEIYTCDRPGTAQAGTWTQRLSHTFFTHWDPKGWAVGVNAHPDYMFVRCPYHRPTIVPATNTFV